MSKTLTGYGDFVTLQKRSGSNNAAKHLFKQVLALNALKRNTGDRRQNFIFNGDLYGVSVGVKAECRQFDDDYVGLLHINPLNGTVEMSQRHDLKENPRHNLTRPSGVKARTVKIQSSYPTGYQLWVK
ncbi:hypothetical protein Hena1_01900 [Erwinia phage Hena1]|uniref:Uncharacterized protein n=1 Tax=Erwinia phage Hena1 TaxID=2678601 RepID=A0A6B9J5P3_9CAUD|nr:hypothetical protein HWC84_gp174 [Erwinia phage Hena1]QGZ16340.1 hypothetical protein Hena1_01900 [Erwinia phage Hena1]